MGPGAKYASSRYKFKDHRHFIYQTEVLRCGTIHGSTLFANGVQCRTLLAILQVNDSVVNTTQPTLYQGELQAFFIQFYHYLFNILRALDLLREERCVYCAPLICWCNIARGQSRSSRPFTIYTTLVFVNMTRFLSFLVQLV